MFDLVGAVELTAGAAIVVAVFAIAFGRDALSRVRLAAALSAWFVVVVALAATEVLHYERGTGTPFVGLAVALPIVVLSLSLFGLPSLRERVKRVPLWPLVAVQAVRVLGVSFVLLHADGRLPAPFAPVAGWGDIAVGAAAIPVAWMVANRVPGWRGWLLVWNFLGLADLATAVTLGVLSSPGPLWVLTAEPGTGIMSTLPWFLIPGFLVPLLATIHIVIFYRIVRGEQVEEVD
jgi:hypothetical protein